MPNDVLFEDLFDYELIKKQNDELIDKFIADKDLNKLLKEVINEYTSPIIQMSFHTPREVVLKKIQLAKELYIVLGLSAKTNEEFQRYFLFIKTIVDIVGAQYSRSINGVERNKVYNSTKVSSRPLAEKNEEDIYGGGRYD